MKKRTLFALILPAIAPLAPGSHATAQVIVPGQSSQLPPAPVAPQAIPDVRIERRGAVPEAGPTGPSVVVNALHITGATRFSESQLIGVAEFVPGHSLSLSELRHMAVLITNYYNARGYVVAQAYLPAQEIKDGVVTIAVVEGRYGTVKLHNQSRLDDGVAQDILAGLDGGDLVEAAPLDRRLLLLSDLPGVEVRSTLSPGTEVGTADLLVDLNPGAPITGALEVDNFGSPYTGALQGGGTVNFNEPLGWGDVASVRVLTSGEGMQYVRGSYQGQLDEVTVGAAYAYFHYRLGKQFTVLHANGWEQSASLYASYPLIRSYDDNLRVLVDADHRRFQDRIDALFSVVDKQTNLVTVGLAGDHHDTLWGDGWDVYSLYVTGGDLDIETPLARLQDAATLRTQGGYSKLNASLDRLQTVSGPFQIYASFRGQLAGKNLDITEKMELGGAYGVRAYPEGEDYGDEGYVATLEARLWLPKVFDEVPGQMQLVAFVDNGWVRFNKSPLFGTSNSATRSGAGVGLNWVDDNDFAVRVSYAHVLGSLPTSAPGTGQFWFEAIKFF